MRLNVCVNEMALFGSYAAVVKGKIFFDSDGSKGGLPTRRDTEPTRYGCASHWQTWFCWRFCVFSCTVWCVIVAGEICFESNDCLESATVTGPVRNSMFKPCVLLSWVLKLEGQTLLHILDKGMVKEFPCRRSRNFKWYVEDGGRGVC